MTETIYVYLSNEGIDVWRPVEATRLSDNVYEICEQDVPDGERWSFPPGSTVHVEQKNLSDGNHLVAVRLYSRG